MHQIMTMIRSGAIIIIILWLLCLDQLHFSKSESQKPNAKGKKSGQESKVDSFGSKAGDVEEKIYVTLPKEVVVIGGGIAGLAAARRITSDLTNFTVMIFEAQKDRYGGRVWTDKLTNIKARGIEVDLGGSAFNVAAKNNPLIQLAEDFELKTVSVNNLRFIIPWENKVFDGEELSDVTKEAVAILHEALNESRSLKEEVSVTDAVNRIIEKADVKDSPGIQLVKCFPSYVVGDYSTRHYKAEALDVGYEKVLLDGMGELLDRLVSGGPEEPPLHLVLNKPVRQIKVDESKQKVIIRTKDGLQTEADIAVVAVPAAVIAAGDIVFEPALPKEYQLAFSEITISNGNKLIVEFERPFWPSENGVFVRAVPSDGQRGYLQTWINVHRLISKPVLAAFLHGKPSIEFEELSDDEAKEQVLAVLKTMFGEELVNSGGNITRFQRSKWTTNRWSKGGSSYPRVGADPALWDLLSEPLCPYVYFVGEHTAFESQGSLHGAYKSGIRAGDQILQRYCPKKMEEEGQRQEAERKRKEKEEKKDKKVKDEKSSNSDEEMKSGPTDKKEEL